MRHIETHLIESKYLFGITIGGAAQGKTISTKKKKKKEEEWEKSSASAAAVYTSSNECVLQSLPILSRDASQSTTLRATFECHAGQRSANRFVRVEWYARVSNAAANFMTYGMTAHSVSSTAAIRTSAQRRQRDDDDDDVLHELVGPSFPIADAALSGDADMLGLPLLLKSRDDDDDDDGGGGDATAKSTAAEYRFFYSLETPLAKAIELRDDSSCVASAIYAPAISFGKEMTAVLGMLGPNRRSLRRDFNAYLAQARQDRGLRDWKKPFMHYNSWFDFYSWQEPDKGFAKTRTMNEANCVNRIETITDALESRGVSVDSFLLDDGWDDKTGGDELWSFEKTNFPNGFEVVADVARKKRTGVGVWLSPWGGYGDAKDKRLAFGRKQGYEQNEHGFSIAGDKYRRRFRDIALNMVRSFGVNMFKFDGMAGSSDVAVSEMSSLLDLVDELKRAAKRTKQRRVDADDADDDLFINLTTGTWPSPF
eukprot:g4268.t1